MTTPIEWTHRPGTIGETWNPTRGCRRVSPGCEHCYAEQQANRFKGKGQPYAGLVTLGKKGPRWTGKGKFVEDMLGAPLHWKVPRTVFVNSMSDLFYERFTNEEIAAVFGVMAATPRHTYQILTKRASRMREWFEWHRKTVRARGWEWEPWRLAESEAMERLGDIPAAGCEEPWPLRHVWLGVSVENQAYADDRVPELIATPAAVRFVSYEPALEHVSFMKWLGSDKRLIDWIIVGGESGLSARPFDVQWAKSVIAQCIGTPTKAFVKQLGAKPYDSMSHPSCSPIIAKDPKGGDWDEWPVALRVREWPEMRP